MFLAICLILVGLYALALACIGTFARDIATDGDVVEVAVYWIVAISFLFAGVVTFLKRKR